MNRNIFFLALALLPTAMRGQTDSLRTAAADSLMQSLPEVMVKGSRPLVRNDGGKLVFDVQGLIKDKPVDNAFDALKQLPGVTPQNDDISLGGMHVAIILNGKLTTMTRQQLIALLKTTPASRVQSAEVMYAAPARYQVRGALINVVLAKGDGSVPLQGEAFAKAEQRHEAHMDERLSLLWNKGRLSADAMVGISHGRSFHTMDKEGVHSLADGSSHDVYTNEVIRGSSSPDYNYRLGADYRFADNHTLSLAYTGSSTGYSQNNTMTGMQTSSVKNASDNTLHNGHLDYTLPIGLNLGADITYYEDNVTQDLVSNLNGSQLDFVSVSQQRINRTKLFVREEHRLGKRASLNYGSVYTHIIDHSRQNYCPTGSTTTSQLPQPLLSRRTENTVNLYAGANGRFSDKLSAEVSFAAEHSRTAVWNEWDFYPVLNVSYVPSQGSVWQLALNSDKRYPDFWAMQDVTAYHGGRYEEIVGNPRLKPSKNYSASLVYVLRGKYVFRTWFDYTKDYFTQTMYQSAQRFAEIDQFNNFDFQQQAGLMAVLPLKVSWWLDARITLIGVWMREKDSDYYDCPFDRNIAYGMTSASSTFRLSRRHDIGVTLSGFARTRAFQGPMDLPPSGNLDIALRYAFARGNAVLNVWCNDIFETSSIAPECRWAGQNLTTRFSCFRAAGVSFSYRFGGYKEKKTNEVDTSRMR